MVFGKCDNSLDTHLEKRKNFIFNIVRQMAKKHRILPAHSNVTSKVGFTLADCNIRAVDTFLEEGRTGTLYLIAFCFSFHVYVKYSFEFRNPFFHLF